MADDLVTVFFLTGAFWTALTAGFSADLLAAGFVVAIFAVTGFEDFARRSCSVVTLLCRLAIMVLLSRLVRTRSSTCACKSSFALVSEAICVCS